MPYAPVPFNVCPCCGTEFGVDDRKAKHWELRQAWINAGKQWFDDIMSPPKNWDPQLQLLNAGFGPILITAENSETQQATLSVMPTVWDRHELERFHVSYAM